MTSIALKIVLLNICGPVNNDMENIPLKYSSACCIVADLKSTQPIVIKKKVVGICIASVNDGNIPEVITTCCFLFLADKKAGKNNNPLNRPSVKNVQLAPCQNPIRINITIILRACCHQLPYLPPIGA
jgi:hypothetical protein